ncbi:MAG: hypothetical protein JEY96_01465 [Bacteroidales bacterium]|nr:hypothetical protein [Bacteroidales bacterium]
MKLLTDQHPAFSPIKNPVRNGVMKRESSIPKPDVLLWNGAFDGLNLVNSLGENVPDVGEDNGERIYDFEVLNDPRLDKSNATYWGAVLDPYFYNNAEHPYWAKLKDYSYRQFQNQMASDNNYAFARLIYLSGVLQYVDFIAIYSTKQVDNNLTSLLNYTNIYQDYYWSEDSKYLDLNKVFNFGEDQFEIELEFNKINADSESAYLLDNRDSNDDGLRVVWVGSSVKKLYASINSKDIFFVGTYSGNSDHSLKIYRHQDTFYGTIEEETKSIDITGESIELGVLENALLGCQYSLDSFLDGFISKIYLKEFLTNNLKTTWRYPSAFTWQPDLGIFWDGEKWDCTFDITTKKIVSTNDYYIKVDGNDSNDGSTLLLAKATMESLFDQIVTDGVSDANIIVSPGTFTNAWGNHSSSIDCNIICDSEAIFNETGGIAGKAVNINTFYMEGISFNGGTGDEGFLLSHTLTTAKSYFKSCNFNGATENGFGAEFGGEIYLDSCTGDSNGNDGLSYHDDSLNNSPRVFEYKCHGINNGIAEADNGSTMHDGGSVIRIQGIYTNNIRNIHDVSSGTRSLNMSCEMNTSRGENTRDNSFNIGCGFTNSTGVIMWLFDCNPEGGANKDVNVYESNKLFISENVENHYAGGEYIVMDEVSFKVETDQSGYKIKDYDNSIISEGQLNARYLDEF